MQVEGWEYYNHAMVPKVPPNQIPDMRPIKNRNIWQFWGGAFVCEVDYQLGLWF